MNSDGTFTEVTLFGETVSGKSLMDKAEQLARDGYFAKNGSEEKEYGKDFLCERGLSCRHKRCWNTGRHDGGDI